MRFSIIIPCYKRRESLHRAITSCLEQTFRDFEVIVVDDCSDPPLRDVCEDFGDSRIRYYKNDVNRGASFSRNAGIDAAAGEYVSFLDSDDVYLPTRLEVIDRLIRGSAIAPGIVFHRQKRVLGPSHAGIASPARLPRVEERLDEYMLLYGNFVQTNTFVVEKSIARRVKFDSECKLYEDTKFLLACWLECNSYIACENKLSVYHDFGQSGRLSRQGRAIRIASMLQFVRSSCSKRAYIGFDAYASSETPFLREPLQVLQKVWRAYRIGVPWNRCVLYIARSAFGSALINQSLSYFRRLRAWMGRASPT